MNCPDGWATGTVDANGAELQYYRVGAGPPLVYLHGFYDNGRCAARLVDDLAADYTVYGYDARAHGQSEAPAEGYAVEDRAADLVGVLDGLAIENPLLVGHSMGANTIAAAVAGHEDLARGVVLEDPAGVVGSPEAGPKERADHVRERVAEWGEESVQEITESYRTDRPERAERLAIARTELRPEIANIARAGYPFVPDFYPAIDCPALVLRQDAGPEQRRADLDAAESLPDGRIVHVPDAGHAVFRDRYDAAMAELQTFLRQF